MTASQFANILHAKRVGRGKWVANCPRHEADGRRHKPSLSISEGRKVPIVFHCMTGCSQRSVIEAMGLTWSDILGDREVATPEMRGRWRDEALLKELERDHALTTILAGFPKAVGGFIMPEFPKHVGDRYFWRWPLAIPGDPDSPPAYPNILMGPDKKERIYWNSVASQLESNIKSLRGRLYPDEEKLRLQRERVHLTIEKHGWDKVWDKFETTERGKAVMEKYGVNYE